MCCLIKIKALTRHSTVSQHEEGTGISENKQESSYFSTQDQRKKASEFLFSSEELGPSLQRLEQAEIRLPSD